MIPVMQKYLSSEKEYGDCWRACLASILECDIEKFPAPKIDENWNKYYLKVFKVLEELGYQWIGYTVQHVGKEALDSKDTGGYILAVGKSPRSKRKRWNHAVVWKNGIVHDPHPDKTGILDIISFEILVKIK